jgi:hypothetical protein
VSTETEDRDKLTHKGARSIMDGLIALGGFDAATVKGDDENGYYASFDLAVALDAEGLRRLEDVLGGFNYRLERTRVVVS